MEILYLFKLYLFTSICYIFMYYDTYCLKERIAFLNKYPFKAVVPNLTLGADHFYKFSTVTDHDLISFIISLIFLKPVVYNLYVYNIINCFLLLCFVSVYWQLYKLKIEHKTLINRMINEKMLFSQNRVVY